MTDFGALSRNARIAIEASATTNLGRSALAPKAVVHVIMAQAVNRKQTNDFGSRAAANLLLRVRA